MRTMFAFFLLALTAFPMLGAEASEAVVVLDGGLDDEVTRRTKLTGQVNDPSGRPLPLARVTIVETNRVAQTDAQGRFAFAEVPSGTYSVAFSAIGYAPQVQRVTVAAEDLVLNATLERSMVELPPVQVTASPIGTSAMTSPQPTSIMSEDEVQANRAASLGETIGSMPGVRNLSTGGGVGKPVIRGLSSNRVLVLADGQRLENQQWGDEHGPQVETGDAARVEVIRGPASVLYGSDALGGVVNVVAPPLPDAIGGRPFTRGRATLAYATNNEQPDGTVSVEGANEGFGVRAAFTGRRSDDLRTPVGRLFNSGGRTLNGTGEIGYRGAWGSVSATYTRRDETVELHEDPAEEPGATPFQRIAADRVRLSSHVPLGSSHIDVDLGYERNRRREFEERGTSDVALGLLAKSYSTDVRLHHTPVGPFAGIVGTSWLRSASDKFGEETLIPNNIVNTVGLYAFEQAELGRWILSFGARADHRRLNVEDDTDLGVVAQRRTYNSITGNVGALYHITEPVALVFNMGRGYRAPTAFDLFSNGVHEGTVRFERGDSTLKNETSLNTDVAIRLQTARLSAEVGAFVNLIDDYIFPNPTGTTDPESGREIFDVSQGNARLTGFEASGEYHATTYLHLRAGADYVRGQNTTLDQPLPFIPPFRTTYSARLEGGSSSWLLDPYFSLGGETNTKQTRPDPEDFAPDGYTLAHIGAGFAVPVGSRSLAIDLQLRNVFDTEYTSFMSRYKTYALDPSRNLIVRMSTDF